MNLFSAIRTPTVEFLCYKEDYGVIPEPYPARKFMPEWYQRLGLRVDGRATLTNSTVKRCPPFLDAMTLGWIIPLAADVEFVTNDDASGVSYKWTHYRPMVENHSTEQIAGHPGLPKPPMKFLNWWAIKVPKDYSILFVPPLNRPDGRFECISGLVDADRYFEFINFPFMFTRPSYAGIVKQGTPLVQAIPIHRSMLTRKATARAVTDAEFADMERTRRRRASHESLYRDSRWVRK